jgi:hypothetical protein
MPTAVLIKPPNIGPGIDELTPVSAPGGNGDPWESESFPRRTLTPVSARTRPVRAGRAGLDGETAGPIGWDGG